MATDTVELIAHLMRRAGFGATRTEIEAYAAQGYDATVEALLHPDNPQWMGDYMIRRFHHEQSGMMGPRASGENWLYRMIKASIPMATNSALPSCSRRLHPNPTASFDIFSRLWPPAAPPPRRPPCHDKSASSPLLSRHHY